VSEKLLGIYAEDGMTLEQLMAFTVTNDHARQEQVWAAIQPSYNKEPYLIRRQLTESAVRASDRRARFVGTEAYVAAGGVVLRDLFEDDDGGWLEDVVLLDRLATEKLAAAAEQIAAEGWKWIEVALDFPYGHTNRLRELQGVPADLTAEERTKFDALTAECAKLESDYEGADELADEVDARLGEIEAALAVLEKRPVRYDPAEIARAGVFVSIDTDGNLAVDRAYVRPVDEPAMSVDGEGLATVENGEPDEMVPAAPGASHAVITIGGAEPEGDDDDAIKPLPDRLVSELTAHRTLALRDAVANNPQVALTMLLHKLCLDTFQPSAAGACLEASVRHVFFPVQAADLKDSPSAEAVAERHEAWQADLPKDETALWDWLAALDETSRIALLAHCISFGVNALYEKGERYGGPGVSVHGVQTRIAQADRLARAVGLDMMEAGWRPTVDNYLGRVTKPRILEAVREAKGEQAAQLIDHLKKVEMAKEAERLLDGAGWLPEPLRLADSGAASVAPTDAVGELPAFLADGEGQDAATHEQPPRPIAAE
jgi:ParB family chromosome partitioning protein